MKIRITAIAATVAAFAAVAPAGATPVCTDGYMGGPSTSECGGRIFPEAHRSLSYVQFSPNPTGFREYHWIEYLAQKYPR